MKKFVVCVFLGVAVALCLIAFNFKHVYMVLTDSSEYAPGYSESAFESIEVGMSQEELVKRLGKPIQIQKLQAGWLRWYGPTGSYVSEDGGLHVPDGDYSKAAIIDYDVNGKALHPPFQGQTADQVETELGKPIKEFLRSSVAYWHYSKSWNSGNYYRRWIGIDNDGFVAEKRAYYYWD